MTSQEKKRILIHKFRELAQLCATYGEIEFGQHLLNFSNLLENPPSSLLEMEPKGIFTEPE